MAKLSSNLASYSLNTALLADCENPACHILDVGANGGDLVTSLEYVSNQVEEYLVHASDRHSPVTRLYVIGNWKPTFVDAEQARRAELIGSHTSNSPLQQTSWQTGCGEIAKLIARMPLLEELTWISTLPFMACIWSTLNSSLSKLIVDLGQPTGIQFDSDYVNMSYITPAEMKPLVLQTKLRELRLLNLRDSYQCVIWETIFSNTLECGMHILDIQMAVAPLVRVDHWRKANEVKGLTVPKEDNLEKEYKGIEGKGILHHAFGTGEYLDDLCMRKARIASGLDEAKPASIRFLKLDGFVVDFVPFDHELSQIELLTCGPNCIDAGLRAPKTRRVPYNYWSRIVNDAQTHCLIQFPNWTGIFDNRGDQRDTHGDVVPQAVGLSTPLNKCPISPLISPTKELLHTKDLDGTLDGTTPEDGYFNAAAVTAVSSEAQASLGTVSNTSTRGSEVPKLTVASMTHNCNHVPAIDKSSGPDSSFSTDDGGILLDQLNDSSSPVSTISNIEQAGLLPRDGSFKATTCISSKSSSIDALSKATTLEREV